MPEPMGSFSKSERQELMAMVKKCLEVVTTSQHEVAAMKARVDVLEERVSMAAGQYRQRVME